MLYQAISLIVNAAGFAASVAVIVFSLITAARCKKRVHLLYTLAGVLYGVASFKYILGALSPYACAGVPVAILIASGLLLIIHIIFLVDIYRSSKKANLSA